MRQLYYRARRDFGVDELIASECVWHMVEIARSGRPMLTSRDAVIEVFRDELPAMYGDYSVGQLHRVLAPYDEVMRLARSRVLRKSN